MSMNAILQSITRTLRPLTLLAASLGFVGFTTPAAEARDDGRYGDRYGRDYRHGDEHRYDRYRHDHDDGGGDKTDVKIDIDFNHGRAWLGRETTYRPPYTERSVRYWC